MCGNTVRFMLFVFLSVCPLGPLRTTVLYLKVRSRWLTVSVDSVKFVIMERSYEILVMFSFEIGLEYLCFN